MTLTTDGALNTAQVGKRVFKQVENVFKWKQTNVRAYVALTIILPCVCFMVLMYVSHESLPESTRIKSEEITVHLNSTVILLGVLFPFPGFYPAVPELPNLEAEHTSYFYTEDREVAVCVEWRSSCKSTSTKLLQHRRKLWFTVEANCE